MNSTELSETVEIDVEDVDVLKKIAKKHKLKTKLVAIAVVCVLLLAAVAAAWVSGNIRANRKWEEQVETLEDEIATQKQQIQDLINTPVVVNPVAPKIELDIIYSEINAIGELATVEYLFTDATRFSDSRQIKDWNIPFTEKSFILKWDGKIKAGIDVSEIAIEVDEDEGNIIVRVPSAEILSYEVDNDSVEILDEKNNIFNAITVDDKVQLDVKTEEAMRERAIENGILDKAQANAEEIIMRLLIANPAIGDAYKIQFMVGE